jgi:hypothetical protein
MTTLREAAQQALAWMHYHRLAYAIDESFEERNLRKALAQEDEIQEMLRTLGFKVQCPESIGITLRRWRDGYAAALAQEEQEQEQEPVAFADRISFDQAMKSGKGHDVWPEAGDYEARTGRKLRVLYTAPPRREWQGLTEEEIRAAYGKDLKYRDGDYARFARAIEAALKEKNNG